MTDLRTPAASDIFSEASSPFSIRAQGVRALLVDDDAFQLEVMTDILHGLGVADISAAQGGERALALLAQPGANYNLMLLDLHMPGMDGFQFMESAAKAGFCGRLIIVSGQGEEVIHAASLVAKLRRFSLLGVVSKPVSKAAFAQWL